MQRIVSSLLEIFLLINPAVAVEPTPEIRQSVYRQSYGWQRRYFSDRRGTRSFDRVFLSAVQARRHGTPAVIFQMTCRLYFVSKKRPGYLIEYFSISGTGITCTAFYMIKIKFRTEKRIEKEKFLLNCRKNY